MKNKWILNFLLIALSVNAISPLLATSLDEDATILLKLNPLPAIKNCWNGFVGSASNKFNSITENASKSNVLAMLGRGAKEVGSAFSWLGGGLISLAGKVPSLYFEKPETLEGFSKGTAAFTAALGISAYLTGKHYWTLYRIGRKITKSKDVAAEGKKFLFGSWKCKTYETCQDLSNNAENVKQELLNEIWQSPSRIHIFDNAGRRIEPKNVTEENIRNALCNEQKMLRKDLTKTISLFTDASQKILELVCESDDNKQIDSDLWYPEAAFDERCFNYLADLNAQDFNKFGELITKKCNFGIKRLLFTPPGGWKFYPQYWRLFPCYNKATEVFWTVYTCYLRTRTLFEIISETTPISISQQSPFQLLLNQVNIMIREQDNVYNDSDQKLQQYDRLSKARTTLSTIKSTFYKDELITISGKFKSINNFLQQNLKKPQNDTALGDLMDIGRTLEGIIKKEIKNN